MVMDIVFGRRIVCAVSWIAAAAVFVATMGCGGAPTASLAGKVTFDGKDIAEGTIQLTPKEGTPGQGGAGKITNGAYTIPRDGGLTAGKYSVVIMATRPANPAEIAKMRAESTTAGEQQQSPEDADGKSAPAAKAASPVVQYLPAKFNIQTELTAELKAGENSKDFILVR